MNPVLFSIILFACGALSSLVFFGWPSRSRIFSLCFAILGSAFLLVESLKSLFGASSSGLVLANPGFIFGFHFSWTPLSCLFTSLISGLSLAASVYAIDYAGEYEKTAASLGFFYNVFLLNMSLVPLAQNSFSFLFCWEGMTLASFFLVLIERQKPASRRAGTIYLVMSHIGTAFIFLLFFLLYRKTGSVEFSAFNASSSQLSENFKNILFLLALIGFGTKAGIVPLHLWLPYAHPAAPSHVSSLMSGVMIKTAIYGFVLVTFYFLGQGPWWWGAVVLVIASISSVLGVLYALMEHDIKRLLAYHSVENIGIILMGIGMGLLFRSFGKTGLMSLALSAGLYHVINHAVFKGLLFLAAGSMVKSVHTRNLEEMGGLIKRMPVTALCFLAGSMAISALPPWNGFASEWLTFQALFSGLGLPSVLARTVCIVSSAALALTGGLAAACFVKAFGISFLAQPRSEQALKAREATFLERMPMMLLSLTCLVLGLFPGAVLKWIGSSMTQILPFRGVAVSGAFLGPLLSGSAQVYPLAILFLLVLGVLAAVLVPRAFSGPARIRVEPAWGCGLKSLSPRMEYTATAFSKPFRMLFSFLYRPVREVSQVNPGSIYFPSSIRYSTEITYIIKEKFYRPPLKFMLRMSHTARKVQAGSLNLYLGYFLAAAIVLLTFVFTWR